MSTDHILIKTEDAELALTEQSTKFQFSVYWGRVNDTTFENVGELPFELTDDDLVRMALTLLNIAKYNENSEAKTILSEIGVLD